MCEGKVINEEGKEVLTFDIYGESVARKETKKIINRLLRKHMDGKVVIKYPYGEKTTITIRSER